MKNAAGRYFVHVYGSPHGKRMKEHHCDGSYHSMVDVLGALQTAIKDKEVHNVKIFDSQNGPTKEHVS